MKLAIQIPSFNEEDHLKLIIDDIRKNMNLRRFESFEIMVIDDGSNDNTLEVAKNAGIKHIVNFKEHRGLAAAFREDLKRGLELGADIIVNTDADLQYRADENTNLVHYIWEYDAKIQLYLG